MDINAPESTLFHGHCDHKEQAIFETMLTNIVCAIYHYEEVEVLN